MIIRQTGKNEKQKPGDRKPSRGIQTESHNMWTGKQSGKQIGRDTKKADSNTRRQDVGQTTTCDTRQFSTSSPSMESLNNYYYCDRINYLKII